MKVAVTLLMVALFAGSALALVRGLSNEQSEWLFAKWMTQHGKVYTAEMAVHRYGIWRKNMDWIHEQNAKDLSYKVAMNEFGDMSPEEWSARLGYLSAASGAGQVKPTPTKHVVGSRHAAKRTSSLPATWDWRDHHAVNPIQNQGQCGSCWAFTTGDSVSGLWAIKTGMLFPVSTQEIIDCSGPEGNQGCNGGLPSQAMQWVIDNGGICDWQEYQYTAETGTCMSTNCTNVATIHAYQSVTAGDENALQEAVYGQVVSTAIQADSQVFQFYTSGVIDDPSCGTQLDHGMTIIGWGTDATLEKDYWQLRNMWGTAWGENGYVRLVRGKNMCGLASMPVYPTL